jgi:hypothetical protein
MKTNTSSTVTFGLQQDMIVHDLSGFQRSTARSKTY